MEEKFLPIGTVVLLKGATKKIMITGFVPKNNENKETYDYLGCPYPEGYVTSNQYLLFNHGQIEKVFYKGFIDDESKEFNNLIHKFLEEQNVKTEKEDNGDKKEKTDDNLEVVEI